MKVQVQTLENLRREMRIEIPLEDIREEYQNVKRQLRNTRLRGFRPGKFPKGWIEKRFRSTMEAEAQEKLFPKYFEQAIQQEQLELAAPADSLKIELGEREPLVFDVSFEVAPEVPEVNYDNLQLEEPEISEVTDEKLDKMLQDLRRARSTRQPKEGSPADRGDLVTFDAVGKVDGKPLTDEENIENSEFEVGGEFFLEFSPVVEGMMAGETKTVSFEMGSSFDEAYKGKQGEFEVTVKSIETLNLPEMNEEFFKSYGHETEEELLSAIREMQENNRQAQRMEELRKAVRPQLNEQLQHIDLPQSLLERHEQSLRANHTAEDNTTEDNTAEKDASPEEQEERINQEMESYRENLRINYLVRKTLREAGLNIDEQDLYSRFSNAAAMMGMSPQDLYNHRYGRVLLERFVETLQEEQALNYIIQRKLGELPAENTSAADAPAEAQASSEAVAG